MARVQLIMPDDDKARFVDQARREGMSLSAWMRAAANERIQKHGTVKQFESPEDIQKFFRTCADLDGPESEPDWEEHLRVMNESRGRDAAAT